MIDLNFEAPIGKRVKLNGCEDFKTETNYDFVYFYDGYFDNKHPQRNLIHKISGINIIPSTFNLESTGQVMEIIFKR